jgi:hypothetical protein
MGGWGVLPRAIVGFYYLPLSMVQLVIMRYPHYLGMNGVSKHTIEDEEEHCYSERSLLWRRGLLCTMGGVAALMFAKLQNLLRFFFHFPQASMMYSHEWNIATGWTPTPNANNRACHQFWKKENTGALYQYFGSTEATSEAFQVQKILATTEAFHYSSMSVCRKSQFRRSHCLGWFSQPAHASFHSILTLDPKPVINRILRELWLMILIVITGFILLQYGKLQERWIVQTHHSFRTIVIKISDNAMKEHMLKGAQEEDEGHISCKHIILSELLSLKYQTMQWKNTCSRELKKKMRAH